MSLDSAEGNKLRKGVLHNVVRSIITAIFEVYYAHIKMGMIKYKSLKASHTEFQKKSVYGIYCEFHLWPYVN
jgi:hypothetical protein